MALVHDIAYTGALVSHESIMAIPRMIQVVRSRIPLYLRCISPSFSLTPLVGDVALRKAYVDSPHASRCSSPSNVFEVLYQQGSFDIARERSSSIQPVSLLCTTPLPLYRKVERAPSPRSFITVSDGHVLFFFSFSHGLLGLSKASSRSLQFIETISHQTPPS